MRFSTGLYVITVDLDYNFPRTFPTVFRSDYILLLFGLVEAELGPHRNDAVEDREGSAL